MVFDFLEKVWCNQYTNFLRIFIELIFTFFNKFARKRDFDYTYVGLSCYMQYFSAMASPKDMWITFIQFLERWCLRHLRTHQNCWANHVCMNCVYFWECWCFESLKIYFSSSGQRSSFVWRARQKWIVRFKVNSKKLSISWPTDIISMQK